MRDTFLDRMAIGKANAKRDRDRGGSAVTVYATARTMYAARGIEAGSWDHCFAEAQSRWKAGREDAIEALRFDLYGATWEGF
jgi:hypothetical protein